MIFTGIDLRLHAGDSLILQGPNGAGKSSLLRVLAGLIPCFHGRVERCVSLALADDHLALDEMSHLGDALAFWADMDGCGAEGLNHAISLMNLDNLRDIPVRMLSAGQRKRAIMARTIASGTPLWLLDEPGNGLDTASFMALGTAMEEHVRGGGAIIAASHFALPYDFGQMLDICQHQPEHYEDHEDISA